MSVPATVTFPSAYAGQVGSGVPGGVTLVVYDNENAEPTDSLEGVDRVVVVGDCGGVADEWRRRGVATVRLNHGWIVGTGMTGVPMALLKAIDRGVYFHVKGADANCAIVHAADLAAAVVALGCGEGRRADAARRDDTVTARLCRGSCNPSQWQAHLYTLPVAGPCGRMVHRDF